MARGTWFQICGAAEDIWGYLPFYQQGYYHFGSNFLKTSPIWGRENLKTFK